MAAPCSHAGQARAGLGDASASRRSRGLTTGSYGWKQQYHRTSHFALFLYRITRPCLATLKLYILSHRIFGHMYRILNIN